MSDQQRELDQSPGSLNRSEQETRQAFLFTTSFTRNNNRNTQASCSQLPWSSRWPAVLKSPPQLLPLDWSTWLDAVQSGPSARKWAKLLTLGITQTASWPKEQVSVAVTLRVKQQPAGFPLYCSRNQGGDSQSRKSQSRKTQTNTSLVWVRQWDLTIKKDM